MKLEAIKNGALSQLRDEEAGILFNCWFTHEQATEIVAAVNSHSELVRIVAEWKRKDDEIGASKVEDWRKAEHTYANNADALEGVIAALALVNQQP